MTHKAIYGGWHLCERCQMPVKNEEICKCGGDVKKTEATANPNHRMGKRTGYELIDGEYHIAQTYRDAFERADTSMEALQGLMGIVSRHVGADMQVVIDTKYRLWQAISDDIGLDPDKDYVYLPRKGVIVERKQDFKTPTSGNSMPEIGTEGFMSKAMAGEACAKLSDFDGIDTPEVQAMRETLKQP